MTKERKERLRNNLVALRTRLAQEAIRRTRDRLNTADRHDDEAWMQAQVEASLLAPRRDEFYEVNAALARLEAGKYGICLDCAGEIEEKRLKARPFAVKCKECKEASEASDGRDRPMLSLAERFALAS